MCEELKALKCEAGAVLRRLRLIRRSRDISFYEDAELTPIVTLDLRAINAVRQGSDPGTSWKIQNTAIGQVGGS